MNVRPLGPTCPSNEEEIRPNPSPSNARTRLPTGGVRSSLSRCCQSVIVQLCSAKRYHPRAARPILERLCPRTLGALALSFCVLLQSGGEAVSELIPNNVCVCEFASLVTRRGTTRTGPNKCCSKEGKSIGFLVTIGPIAHVLWPSVIGVGP